MKTTSSYRYPWPASAITTAEMAALYRARQRSKTPITRLIALAIREMYADPPAHAQERLTPITKD